MKKRLLIVLMFTFIISLIGCSGAGTKKEGIIYLQPVDLFAGKAAKFQPFLGNFSGAVHIKYAGKKKYLEAKLDIWENGEKTKTNGSIGIPLVEKNGQYIIDHEVIISVNDVNYEEESSYYIIKTAFVDGNGSSSSELRYKADKKYNSFGTMAHDEPIQISENEPAFAWGIHATDTNSIRTAGLTEEGLAETDWALVLTIELSDKSM